MGVWRDGELLVVEAGVKLPAVCLKCGGAGEVYENKSLAGNVGWVPFVSGGLMLLGNRVREGIEGYQDFGMYSSVLAVLLLVGGWLYGRKKAIDLCYSLCEADHRASVAVGHHLKLVAAGFGACVFLAVLNWFLEGEKWVTVLFAVVGAVAVMWFGYRSVAIQVVPSVVKMDGALYWIKGVGEEFLERLPPWPGR